MDAFRQQYRQLNKAPREIEAVQLDGTKRPLRRICKSPHPNLLGSSLPRFGPFYSADHSQVSRKEDAWRHLLKKSKPDEETVTIEKYLSAMRGIEETARATYADGALDGFTESEFRWMMIKDGCFFLQMALFMLGASEQLGYSDNHVIFGKKQDNPKVFRGWIESMFFVGNQIPLVVLNELMKQKFFQDVIEKHRKWKRPSDLLSKKVLYDLLIVPAKDYAANNKTSCSWLFEGIRRILRSTHRLKEQPSDLLHGLHCLLLGPGDSRNESMKDTVIAQADGNDLEEGRGTAQAISVSELKRKGIHFRKSNGDGLSLIHFREILYVYPCLSLPPLKVDDQTEIMYKNMKVYETTISHQQEGKCQVLAYLRFLKELICTHEDVNILESKGIIEATNVYQKDQLLRLLSKLSCKDTTQNLNQLRLQLRYYSTFPWERFKLVAIIAFLLTILQSIFGVLSYVKQLETG